MLEYLRKAAERPVAKILIGLLTFSFVGWGVASWVFGQATGDDTIVRVGGTRIKTADFETARSRAISMMDRAEQKQLYSDQYTQKQFSAQILSGMTSRALLDNRAKYMGFSVSNSAIAAFIRNTPEFQIKGKFSAERFDAVLNSIGFSEDAYANYIRGEALRGMTVVGISSKIESPNFAAIALYKSRYKTRKIEYTNVSYADFPVTKNPTDEQLKDIYAQNPKMIPETRVLNYVLVPVAKMDNPDQYDRGYDIAQKLEDSIIGGEPMKSAAAKMGAKFVSYSDLTKSSKVSDPVLGDSVMLKVFEMDSGLESEITETKSGFAIFRVEKILPQHAAPLSDVRSQIVNLWRIGEQKKQAYVKANEMLTAKKFGGKPVIVGRANGAPIDVLNSAFANDIGSSLIVPSNNSFYILNISEEIQPNIDSVKLAAIKKESDNLMRRAISDDYTAFLSREYPLKINERLYKKIFGE